MAVEVRQHAQLLVRQADLECRQIRLQLVSGEQVNGKSIMGLMMLAAGQGSKLRITCEGSDAESAIQEIEELVQRRFDED